MPGTFWIDNKWQYNIQTNFYHCANALQINELWTVCLVPDWEIWHTIFINEQKYTLSKGVSDHLFNSVATNPSCGSHLVCSGQGQLCNPSAKRFCFIHAIFLLVEELGWSSMWQKKYHEIRNLNLIRAIVLKKKFIVPKATCVSSIYFDIFVRGYLIGHNNVWLNFTPQLFYR